MSETVKKPLLEVTVGDGKYTVVQDATGDLRALRYGEEWRDLCGDGMVLALAQEVRSLREEIASNFAAIPPRFQVKVREVAGPESDSASLAVSLAKLVKSLDAFEALQQACEVAYKRNSAAIDLARKTRAPVEILTKMAAEGEIFRAALQKAGHA